MHKLLNLNFFLSFFHKICPSCADLKIAFHWWYARALFTQQRLLENVTEVLMDAISEHLNIVERLLDRYAEEGDDQSSLNEMKARFFLFFGLVHHYHRHDKLSRSYFQRAQECAGLEWHLSGALGRRTKFQQNDIAQLILEAKNTTLSTPKNETEPEYTTGSNDPPKKLNTAPKSLDLNDDTLLDTIAFKNQPTTTPLSPLDQSILLAFCLNIKNTNPESGLTSEQIHPFLDRVLTYPQNWLIHSFALLLRSRLESTKSRTVERAVLQVQALVDQWSVTDECEGGASAWTRCEWVWEVFYPARWEMKKELAEKWASIGMIRSALEIFEELEMWDQVIACYQTMDENEKVNQFTISDMDEHYLYYPLCFI
jgi:hypothetical protein